MSGSTEEENIYERDIVPIYVEIVNGFINIFSSITDEFLFDIVFCKDLIVPDIEKKKFKTEDVVNSDCCICISDFVVNEDISTLDCNHTFHFECICEWVQEKQTCPMCRGKIDIKEIEIINPLFDC